MLTKDKKTTFISCTIENYIDPKVYNEVQGFYAKECITLLGYGFLAISPIENNIIEKTQFTECEISPFHKNDISCQREELPSFNRQASATQFAAKKINFAVLQSWLINTFSPDEAGRRPYPSAGGLYPVEPLIFLFEECVDSAQPFISGCYHFRPMSQTLQLIKPLSKEFFYNQLLHSLIDIEQCPNFAMLYLAHLGKSIFKYRYRGYRHAVMEAGSMYQLACATSQAIGLTNSVWSSFSEHEFLAALDLDPGTFMPITMQFFGYAE